MNLYITDNLGFAFLPKNPTDSLHLCNTQHTTLYVSCIPPLSLITILNPACNQANQKINIITTQTSYNNAGNYSQSPKYC